MDEYDPNIVARLVALNERTRKAWAHPHNKHFYVPASFRGFPVHGEISRESTPVEEDSDSDSHVKESEPELRITFDSRPKNVSKGWTFGSDQNLCDVYCGEHDRKNDYYIGRQTFLITISKRGDVILKHIKNTNRTKVQYNSQKVGDRREFIWIMLPECRSIVVTSANQLKFRVIVAKHGAKTELSRGLFAHFLKDVEDSMPSLPLLLVDSEATTADTSLVSTPKTQPFYYRREAGELGRGSFGKVDVVVDVSTGFEYAGKSFFGDFERSEPDILAKQNHENILGYVALSNDDGPLLVTEYLKEGNLSRPWRLNDRSPWQPIQVFSILAQSLRALASLHASPNCVTHRDIKPENILVADRERTTNPGEPGPWIKIADFGLATEGTKCEGSAGTWLYQAPEVFGQEYDSKVDIWSLGVVILQLLLGGRIPKPSRGYLQGPQWCEDVILTTRQNFSFSFFADGKRCERNKNTLETMLWGFITNFMLKYDPKKRLSAQECLNAPVFSQIQSGLGLALERQRKDVGQQCSGVSVDLKVNEEAKRIPTHSDIGKASESENEWSSLYSGGEAQTEPELRANPVLKSSHARAPMYCNNTSPATYDPGVEETVALKGQGSNGSKTAVPPHTLRPDDPQPLSYGLALGDKHDNLRKTVRKGY
ncbi:hypothetical protein HO173_000496 [Letharia columbiana]|uniref:Protein kinase domain-containing protein n=1 Tax=Letharia columbiana TaxID=112416 RepID=A0A8H6LAV2_9LECA|nr:uncharacterized protein HO173_000496 [Letharia columbiana]KAF6241784.1 hypothetical protein HO173_000496 [Letharia columbiana]